MAGNGREGGSTLLFTLAWPWMSKASSNKGSLSLDESSFANLAQDNASCSFFKNELELLECAVADEGEPPVGEKVVDEKPPSPLPTGSMMRAILRDELYRAVTESTSSSAEAGVPAVTPGRRLSVQFVDPQSRNSTLRVDIGRRVMWGNVDVKEYEREKEWSPEFEEQVTRIKQQHNGAELEAVYELLVDEFATEKPVFIITSGGKKFRATVCITNQQLLVRRDISRTTEVTARVTDVSSVRFGVSKAYMPYVKKERNVHLSNANCLTISLTSARRRSLDSTSFVSVSQKAERNSFALLLRTMNRVVQRTSIGDWEDAIEELDTEAEETEEETQSAKAKRETEAEERDQPDKGRGPQQSRKANGDEKEVVSQGSKEKVDLARLTSCLTSLAAGMQVKKVTRKGTSVDRRLSLAGVSLQLFSLKANKGQIVGVFDDVVKTEAGQDDPCFQALKANQQLPDADLCAVVKLTDHSFPLIFKSRQQRDNFVYAMTHLHESDEVLKYL